MIQLFRMCLCYLLILWFLPALAPATASLPASFYEQRQGPASLSFQADRVENHLVEIRLARTLLVTITLEGSASLVVEPIAKITVSPGWTLRPSQQAGTTDLGSGQVRWQQVFPVVPAVAATAGEPRWLDLQVGPLRFRRQPSAQVWEEITWKPIRVRVLSEVARADLSELAEITPPEEIPKKPTRRAWLSLVLLSGIGAVLLVGSGKLRRWLTTPPPPVPPEVRALQDLEEIEKLGLPEAGEIEKYHTLVSDLMRTYVERRYRLPASHQTTAEFLETVRQSPSLSTSQQGFLQEFWHRCDLAKFARAAASPEECRELADLARSFIRETSLEPEPKAENQDKIISGGNPAHE
jgi:hypothetical protein